MAPRPRINLKNCGKVLALSEEGSTQRAITIQVGYSQKSASDILKKQRDTGTVKDKKICN